MNSLFDDLKEGLDEAIDYEKGIGSAKSVIYVIDPVTRYDNKEIKRIRKAAGMTQLVFADYMGVSVKTVEAWELGRTHPTGPAYRLLHMLKQGKTSDMSFVSIVGKDGKEERAISIDKI